MVRRSSAYSVDVNGSVIGITLFARPDTRWATTNQYAQSNVCSPGAVKGPCALQIVCYNADTIP